MDSRDDYWILCAEDAVPPEVPRISDLAVFHLQPDGFMIVEIARAIESHLRGIHLEATSIFKSDKGVLVVKERDVAAVIEALSRVGYAVVHELVAEVSFEPDKRRCPIATLEKAISIAAEAHAGQVDKAGAPYILHPLRVMLAVFLVEERIAAVLHDVVEDTPWTLARLRAQGFSEAVIAALEALTHREGESYDDFVRRAALDPIARTVKRADLADNMDLSRISAPTARDHARVEKYRNALPLLDAR